MNSLYVLQTPTQVITTWERPPVVANKVRYQQRTYSHPDTQIFVSKTSNVKRYNHRALDYAVMLALQDAHMSVSALERLPKIRRKPKTPVRSSHRIQLSLFED